MPKDLQLLLLLEEKQINESHLKIIQARVGVLDL